MARRWGGRPGPCTPAPYFELGPSAATGPTQRETTPARPSAPGEVTVATSVSAGERERHGSSDFASAPAEPQRSRPGRRGAASRRRQHLPIVRARLERRSAPRGLSDRPRARSARGREFRSGAVSALVARDDRSTSAGAPAATRRPGRWQRLVPDVSLGERAPHPGPLPRGERELVSHVERAPHPTRRVGRGSAHPLREARRGTRRGPRAARRGRARAGCLRRARRGARRCR